jgi:hypothetical protein
MCRSARFISVPCVPATTNYANEILQMTAGAQFLLRELNATATVGWHIGGGPSCQLCVLSLNCRHVFLYEHRPVWTLQHDADAVGEYRL